MFKTKILQNKQKCLDTYCVFDLETTGLSPATNKIIEIAILKIKDNRIVDTYESLINPNMRISRSASRVNGISDDMVMHKPSFDELKDDILAFIGNDVLVGHNVTFDMKFLECELHHKLNNKTIDTLTLSRKYYPQLAHHRLQDMRELLHLSVNTHRALSDCICTKELYDHLKAKYQQENSY